MELEARLINNARRQKPTLDALGAVHAAGLSSFHEKNQKAHGPSCSMQAAAASASSEQGPDHETSFSALAALWYYTEYSSHKSVPATTASVYIVYGFRAKAPMPAV